MNQNRQSGFVALMSVIIILAVLLVISASISFTSFSSRFNVSDSEYKKRSSALAEACVANALLQLAQTSSVTPKCVPIDVGGTCPTDPNQCTILSATANLPMLGQTTFKTQGVFPLNQPQASYTNLTVIASSTGLSTVSWYETPN